MKERGGTVNEELMRGTMKERGGRGGRGGTGLTSTTCSDLVSISL